MKSFLFLFTVISIVDISAVAADLTPARSEVRLKVGNNILIKPGQEALVTCEAGSPGTRSATVFHGTTTYVGANCKSIKVYPKTVKGTATVLVHTQQPIECDGSRYYLAQSVTLEDNKQQESFERVLISADDLIFEN